MVQTLDNKITNATSGAVSNLKYSEKLDRLVETNMFLLEMC